MHLGTSSLLKFFQAHRDDESLVLNERDGQSLTTGPVGQRA